MTSLLWPGDDLAGTAFSDAAVLGAMVLTEDAWLAALVAVGIAPADARADLLSGGPRDPARLAARGAAAGTPVSALVDELRSSLGDTSAAWVHRGLTSQDVIDSALMICARDAVIAIRADLRRQAEILSEIATTHRATPMIARTLTQHAVPTTFGAKVAGWLHGILDALEDLDELRFPVQLGGAAGTRAAVRELAVLTAQPDPDAVIDAVVHRVASACGLDAAPAWHTVRMPVVRIGDALVRCIDAWGHIANDVLVLGRPEIGELTEPSGGRSTTMPQKANPVLSVLVRRAALNAPGLGAQLHLASAAGVDERSDGAWHAEWLPLQLLARHAVSAAVQTRTLLEGLQVHPERMRATMEAALPAALAERDVMRGLVKSDHGVEDGYLGTAVQLAEAAVARAAVVGGATR